MSRDELAGCTATHSMQGGVAMMSPSAISSFLRILGRKGKLARNASGKELLDTSLS